MRRAADIVERVLKIVVLVLLIAVELRYLGAI